eukprot:TRINITY_DN45328_c0_g1_i1.p3 TRINITY_DN45328_c0_g1~~TRINITY_DN45328_c0_g1_i1.p3  ORF type:complete len:119 (-),score=30.92 TRINITY_DN45328_c0_g1_i1:205-561(-)
MTSQSGESYPTTGSNMKMDVAFGTASDSPTTPSAGGSRERSRSSRSGTFASSGASQLSRRSLSSRFSGNSMVSAKEGRKIVKILMRAAEEAALEQKLDSIAAKKEAAKRAALPKIISL